MSICILLTSVGGMVSPGIIENLRNIPKIDRIIGTDMSAEAIGFHFVDKGYIVPRGDAPDYITVLSELSERESVDVIIPGADEEVLALSRHKDTFKKKGISIICSPYDITSVAIDKGSMLTFLEQSGVSVPKYYLPTSKSELLKAVDELGYPSRPVVIKPRRGRGGRGFRVLKEDIDILGTRESRDIRLKWFMDVVPENKLSEIVLMEYLPGDDYSVDVLAGKGELFFVIPRRRIKAILGPSLIGEVVWNQEVVNVVEQVTKIFGFDSITNIQLKYSAAPEEMPMIYEINPRVSGTIVASTAAGIDLLNCGIKYALGMDIPAHTLPCPVKMTRYLKEYFEKERTIKE